MTAGPPTGGRLLLAGPGLEDPNFRRTVVFMVEHNEDGALGGAGEESGTSPSCATTSSP